MRSTSRARTCSCSAAWASSSRATTSSPLVPLSSRWTIPGRSGSLPPPRISASSLTSVGPWWEGAGWTTRPAGLSTTARDSSRWTICSAGSAIVARGLGIAEVNQDHQHDPGGYRDVGEVEGRPRADVDVVGHLARREPVEQVAEGAAGQQPNRDPHPRLAGVAAEDEGDQRQGSHGDEDEPEAGAAGEAEGDSLVVGEGEAQRPQHIDFLSQGEAGLDPCLDRLVGGDHDGAEDARQGPRASGGAHPRMRPTIRAWATKRTIRATIGLRSSAKPPPPTGRRKRRKKLR